MERREFLTKSAEAALFYSFYHFLTLTRAWGKSIEPIIKKWIREIEDISASVQNAKITPQEWQNAIERLHSKVPLKDIIKFVDLDRALKIVKYPKEKLGGIVDTVWPEIAGLPKAADMGHKLFIYRKGTSTPPHAHNHLVSAHLVVKGNIHVRTFDRIQDLDKAVLIKVSRDQVAKPGMTVSMSDYKDNVHWFEGLTDISVSFDVPVPNIEPKKEYVIPVEGYSQFFIDPTVPARPDGLIEAPVIKFVDSIKQFA